MGGHGNAPAAMTESRGSQAGVVWAPVIAQVVPSARSAPAQVPPGTVNCGRASVVSGAGSPSRPIATVTISAVSQSKRKRLIGPSPASNPFQPGQMRTSAWRR